MEKFLKKITAFFAIWIVCALSLDGKRWVFPYPLETCFEKANAVSKLTVPFPKARRGFHSRR
jgi:hypothetical protein